MHWNQLICVFFLALEIIFKHIIKIWLWKWFWRIFLFVFQTYLLQKCQLKKSILKISIFFFSETKQCNFVATSIDTIGMYFFFSSLYITISINFFDSTILNAEGYWNWFWSRRSCKGTCPPLSCRRTSLFKSTNPRRLLYSYRFRCKRQ